MTGRHGPASVAGALSRVVDGLLGRGEPRPGQEAMAEAVAGALRRRRHLVVQAGTGTGKSLGYLVPALLSGRKVVVATATKALQDQLAHKDLPLVADRIGAEVSFAVLKGRSNYLCRQRIREIVAGGEQADLALGAAEDLGGDEAASGEGVPAGGRPGGQVRQMLEWAGSCATGDRAELDFEPSPAAWAAVSVTSRECPGASRCPSGGDCFAEAARERAEQADLVVVNTHLYGAHVASGGSVIPEHDVVVFDEAHELEDVMSSSLGHEVSSRRLGALARAVSALGGGADLARELSESAERLDAALGPVLGERLGDDEAAGAAIELAQRRVRRATSALRQAGERARLRADGQPGSPEETAARARALVSAGHLAEDLAAFAEAGPGQVAWVEGTRRFPVLRVAPVDIGPVLADQLWGDVTSVLTSATIPRFMATRLGLPESTTDELDVGSPFPYEKNALLYCAAHLPDRRREGSEAAAHREMAALIAAAGGRTLALFTSWKAMESAARALEGTMPFSLLTQSDLPKPALVEAFSADESACLFATMGFWHGLDVPGPSLSMVIIDRIPFPRPDDPLMQARRELAGPSAFRSVDLPRAASLLAQGAGRLIRSSADRGVVAVLDARLARASYRWDLVHALPPMRRTRHRHDVEAFFAGDQAESRPAR